MIRLLGIVLALVLAWPVMSAHATIKYVCPIEGTYGASNGSDLANCFDGPDDVWSTGAPTSGDTVIICGRHRLVSGPYYGFLIQVNMTYQLGAASDCGTVGRGELYGSVRDTGTGWTYDAGNNAYKKEGVYGNQVRFVAPGCRDDDAPTCEAVHAIPTDPTSARTKPAAATKPPHVNHDNNRRTV